MGTAGTQMLVELTEFDRPYRLGSRATSPIMQTSGALTVAADGDSSHELGMAGASEGLEADARPAVRTSRGAWERTIWTSMKQHMENMAPSR